MLVELTVEDIALIDHARLEFGPGLNLLTGETGAGKSILIDALGLAVGARASPELVREGAAAGRVDAVFALDPAAVPRRLRETLEELGLAVEEDGQLILSREISSSGRSMARINGRPVTVTVLRRVAAGLIEIHGQGDNQLLLDPGRQLELLDAAGGDRIQALRARVAELVARLRRIDRERQALAGGDERERARRLDLLRFQLEEIDAARIEPDEEERLAARRRLLSGAERLARSLAEAYEVLYAGSGAAVDQLAAAARALEEAATVDPELKSLSQRLQSLGYEVEDVAREVRARAERVEHDPAELAAVEERLARLQQLKRKYGDTLEEVLAYREQVAAELLSLEGAAERLSQLDREREAVLREAAEAARRLHEVRRQVAEQLAGQMKPVLAALGMPGADFRVEFSYHADEQGIPWQGGRARLTERGADRVEFLLAANPGEPARPLARAASGGERSRVMLALRSLLVAMDDVPTVIFDEVDTGVGGETAWAVGERLARIAASRQVLCVTHLAPITALADRHFAVRKETRGSRTLTRVRLLSEEERLQELARMLGTGTVEKGTEAARILLERARRARRAAG
ncbi:MAG: DNA repair protein RecN [Symbiobacteriaceae bacterium]|nr:MAG: DNA repair protein RecN [Bacillota bacterium]